MKKKGVSAHVYITNNKIQVLTGSCVKNKLQVVNFYEEPLEEGCILNGIIMNNYSLQNTLTQMWQKNNLPTKNVTHYGETAENPSGESEERPGSYPGGVQGY